MKRIEFIPDGDDWKEGFVLWIGRLVISWDRHGHRGPFMEIKSRISIGWYPY